MEGFPQNKKETTLKVSSNFEVTATNDSSGEEFEASNILMTRSEINDGVSYYALDNLSNTENIRIEVNGKEIDFPESMKNNLAGFFRVQNDIKGPFDCGSFAHLLNSIDYNWPFFKPEKFTIEELDSEKEEGLQAGDTIFLSQSENPSNYMVKHWAIYLDDGLYISKFGPSGKLIVTDKENMLKGFSSQYAFKAIPLNS